MTVNAAAGKNVRAKFLPGYLQLSHTVERDDDDDDDDDDDGDVDDDDDDVVVVVVVVSGTLMMNALEVDLFLCIFKDVNMMSLSDDPTNSNSAMDGDNIKCIPASEKNAPHESNEQADVKPSGTCPAAKEQSPAWLSKEPTEGSAKVKLPPMTVPANKRKQKRVLNKKQTQNSKGKLNRAIEPLQEETNESNANV